MNAGLSENKIGVGSCTQAADASANDKGWYENKSRSPVVTTGERDPLHRQREAPIPLHNCLSTDLTVQIVVASCELARLPVNWRDPEQVAGIAFPQHQRQVDPMLILRRMRHDGHLRRSSDWRA